MQYKKIRHEMIKEIVKAKNQLLYIIFSVSLKNFFSIINSIFTFAVNFWLIRNFIIINVGW